MTMAEEKIAPICIHEGTMLANGTIFLVLIRLDTYARKVNIIFYYTVTG